MEKLKNIFLTCCCSFTLVVVINCMFSTLFAQNGYLSLKDIFMVLLTCIIISITINMIRFESIISSYIVMMIIIFIMEYLCYGRSPFTLLNILLTLMSMSFVFIIVYLTLYYVNEKDAKKINSILKNRNHFIDNKEI